MIDYNEINNFIIKVFNYYNGRINLINNAILDINWANLNGLNVGGYSRLPNIVTINPMVICRFYKYDEFVIKANIIDVIIHELYHTDQIINYKFYMSDVDYNRFIEHACEMETAIYIMGHTREINDIFGIDLPMSDTVSFYRYMSAIDSPGIRYQRRYYYDHIFMCIDDMCGIDPSISSRVYQYIKDNIIEKHDISIIVNNEMIDVCRHGELMSIHEFNKIYGKYECTGVHNVSHNINYDKDTHILLINIDTEILNLMCKKI